MGLIELRKIGIYEGFIRKGEIRVQKISKVDLLKEKFRIWKIQKVLQVK